jgi:MFS family permease
VVFKPGRVLSALGTAVRNENVRRVELAWGADIAAEWAHFVALGVFAYEHGGTAAVGIAGLARLLPAAVVAPFAASLGDHFRRERFLLTMTLIGSVSLAASAAAAFAGNRILVFTFAAVVGLSSTLVRPALQALLPSLVRTPAELIAANAATSTIESVGTLAGPLVAGVLVAVADVGVVFLVCSATLLLGAALLARVRVESQLAVATARDAVDAREMIAAGFRAVAHSANTRLVAGLIIAQTFVRGALNVLIVVVVFRVLDGSASDVGYLTAAIGIGGLVGAIGAMALPGRRLAVPFGVSLVFWGVPIALIAAHPTFASSVLLLAVVGAANSVEDVTVFTLLQRIVPNETLTRVLGLVWGLAMGGVAIGSIAAPAIVGAIGPRLAFVVVGAILPVLAFFSYRRLVEIDRTIIPSPELELIEQVPMFAPLSIATKELVASRLIPTTVPAGEAVIRSGERGDRFYIVGDGEFEIDADGLHELARHADYFGEIALLRDVPRTATVKATVHSHLFALKREDFLAAVTGHSMAHAAGQEVADARLAGVEKTGEPSSA